MFKTINRLMVGIGSIVILFGGSLIETNRVNAAETSQQVTADDSVMRMATSFTDTDGNQLSEPGEYTINKAATGDLPSFNTLLPGYKIDNLKKIILGVTPSSDLSYQSQEFDFGDPVGGLTVNWIDASGKATLMSEVKQEDYISMNMTYDDMVKYIFKNLNGILGTSNSDTFPASFINNLKPYTSIKVIYNAQTSPQATATVSYVTDNNPTQPVKTYTIKGPLHKIGTYVPTAPTGYQLVDTKPIAYTLGETKNLTVHVKSVSGPTPVTPSTPTGEVTTPKQDSSSTVTTPAASESTTKQPDTATTPTDVAVKGAAVYATKGIYLYKNATFTNTQRVAKYSKAKRISRPMFVVTGYARSANGALRYKVRDVNRGRKTAGKVGYITANSKYVVPVYYKTMPKSRQITVINPKGVNAYKRVNLTDKVTNYKKGTHVTVKKIVKHRLTTRYQLSNGTYITGNKKLVIQTNH